MSVITSDSQPVTDDVDTTAVEVAGTDTDLVDDEMLVEEISIDGMCGVY